MSRTLFLFLLLTLLIAGPLAAQEEEVEQPAYQVTVTADRLEESLAEKTDSITVITREDIETHQWNYVIDALRQTPGLTILQSGSPGKVTSSFLRGASATQVLVLVDGIPVNNPYFGGTNLEDLTTTNVERIEVLRGPQSPLYGSDSMGGVIQIITRRGQGPAAVDVSFEGGSYQTFREGAALRGGSDRYDYSIDFSRQDTEGQTDNDEFRENVLSAQAGYRFTDSTDLRFVGRTYDSHAGIPFDYAFQPSPLQNQDSTLWLSGATLRHRDGSYLNLSATLSYTDRSYHIEDPQSEFTPLTESDSGVTQINLQNDFQLGASDTLTAGYEFEHQSINGNDITGSFLDETINNHAVFVHNKLEAGKWILAAGIRLDHYNTFGDTVNPRVSGAYRITDHQKVRASFATSFRAPAAGDLYYPFYGNPDLKPEKSRAWEVGFDQDWNGANFSAAWFRSDYEDLITFDPLTFLAGNVAQAKMQGLELSAGYSTGPWSIQGSYAYLDAKDETTGERLQRRPEHSGSFRVAYNTSRWGAAVSLLALGNRLESDFRTFPSSDVLNPGYATLGLAGYYRILDGLKLEGRVENLTDKQYEQILGYPAPGVGFYGGFAVGL